MEAVIFRWLCATASHEYLQAEKTAPCRWHALHEVFEDFDNRSGGHALCQQLEGLLPNACAPLQVVTVYRLMEQFPVVTTAAFMQHELAAAGEARQQQFAPVQQQYQQLQLQFQQHKAALGPGLAQPSRCSCLPPGPSAFPPTYTP